MKEILSWKNGDYLSEKNLGVSAWDAHYFFGWAVFDAFRTYNHKLFHVDYHLDRLYKSASLTGIDIKYSKSEILDKISNLIEINKELFNDDEYRFMIFATPGKFKIYNDMGDIGPNLTIQLTTTSRYAKHIYPHLKEGWTSLVTHQKQIPSRFFDVRIKSCSRLHYGIADMECKQYGGATNPILLDEHGNLCESSGSNIAFVKENTVHIPIGTDMLDGCTLKVLKESCYLKGIPIKEEIYKPYDLIDCNGILYTSTYSGITPSYKLIYNSNEYILNNTGLYNEIMKGFNEIVGLNAREQWRKWYERTISS